MKLSDCTIGQRVLLTRCTASYARGCEAVIEKIIKRRKVVRVRLSFDGSINPCAATYDADVCNVDPIKSSELVPT